MYDGEKKNIGGTFCEIRANEKRSCLRQYSIVII